MLLPVITFGEVREHLTRNDLTLQQCYHFFSDQSQCKFCGFEIKSNSDFDDEAIRHLRRCQKFLKARSEDVNLRLFFGFDVHLKENQEVLSFLSPVNLLFNETKTEIILLQQNQQDQQNEIEPALSKLTLRNLSYSKEVERFTDDDSSAQVSTSAKSSVSLIVNTKRIRNFSAASLDKNNKSAKFAEESPFVTVANDLRNGKSVPLNKSKCKFSKKTNIDLFLFFSAHQFLTQTT